jgi:DNA primase
MNWYKISQVIDIEQHLRERGLNPQTTRVIIDKESGVATFLIVDPSGKFIGYQKYDPTKDKKQRPGDDPKNLKYYTYIMEPYKQSAIWGWETIDKSKSFIFIAEGIFDAIKIHNMGLPALAVLGAGKKPAVEQQLGLLGKTIIAILDRDKAGNKLKRLSDKWYVVPEPYKDLGEMPQEEVNIFIGNILKREA